MAIFRHAQVAIDLPDGWEARGFSRTEDAEGERTYSVVHIANFPLPAQVADYGGGAVERMRPNDVFLAVLEFGPESLGTPLFDKTGAPTLSHATFDPNTLQRGIRGQSGVQQFFTAAGRPYCLYVVLGAHLMRFRGVPAINSVIHRLRFS